MAEGGGLLNRYTLQRRIEGSNPSGSASLIGMCYSNPRFPPRGGALCATPRVLTAPAKPGPMGSNPSGSASLRSFGASAGKPA